VVVADGVEALNDLPQSIGIGGDNGGVDNRFGWQARYGCTADMLDGLRDVGNGRPNPRSHLLINQRPLAIVINHDDRHSKNPENHNET